MKVSIINIQLPQEATRFSVRMPRDGVVLSSVMVPRLTSVILARQVAGEEPEPVFVPELIVQFDPDEDWIERHFVTCPTRGVVETPHPIKLERRAHFVHPMTGLAIVVFEVMPPTLIEGTSRVDMPA